MATSGSQKGQWGLGRCPPKAIASTGKIWFEMMEKDKKIKEETEVMMNA